MQLQMKPEHQYEAFEEELMLSGYVFKSEK